MTSYIEAWYTLFDDAGITSGTFNERQFQWLDAQGITSGTLDERWLKYFAAQGYSTGTLNERWLALMAGSGFETGTLNERQIEWLTNQFVLATLSVQPIIALDIRRLTGTSWATDDPIATLRETGGDTDDTFSYAGSPPILDFSGIDTFIGVNDGRYDTWHNQVGGNDAVQATDANQPLFLDRAGPDFDGTAYFMSIAHAANQLLTDGFTIVLGFRPDAFNGGMIVNKSDNSSIAGGFRLSASSTASTLSMRVVTTSVLSSGVFTAGTWHHAIITVSAAGAVAFYRNNVAAGTGTTDATSGITSTNPIRIGARYDGTTAFFNGGLDHLLILPGVITATDRAALFAAWQTYRLPAAFATGGWSVADKETDGAATVTISTTPDDKDSALTDLEYRLDGGSAVSFGAATTGDYDITGLTNDQEYGVQVRAVNSAGNGAWSAAKTVTPTEGAYTGPLDGLETMPILALSTRNLFSPAATNAATIRRVSDSDPITAGYVGDPLLMDYASVDTHIGGSSGTWSQWYDQSGSDFHPAQATPSAQPTYTTGKNPVFNGSSHFLTVPHAANQLLTSGLTIAFWFKGPGVGGSRRIIEKADPSTVLGGFLIRSPSTSQFAFAVNGGPSVETPGGAFTANEWNFAVVTCAADGAAVWYRNNSEIVSGWTKATSGITYAGPIGIMGREDGTSLKQGEIELLLFPGVISAADQTLIYGMGAPA